MLPDAAGIWPTSKVEAYKYTDLSRLGKLTLPDGSLTSRCSAPQSGELLTLSGTQTVTLEHLIAPGRSAGQLLIEIAAQADITLIESHTSTQPGLALAQQALRITLQGNARLTHIRTQALDLSAIHLSTTQVTLGRDSQYKQVALTTGAELSRHELHLNLQATGSRAELYALQLLRGQQHGDITTTIAHNQPHTSSVQLIKNVLDEQARGVYQGGIRVAPHAQKTDGQQQSRALLLSPHAEMNTKPELEIFADDVKCSHGAAIGALDEQALFYLRARGLPLAAARALLIDGFVTDILDYAPEAVRETLQAHAHTWLEHKA